MTIYLDEEWLGEDQEIVFPNVQTCIALIVSNAGTMAGMHISRFTEKDELLIAGRIMLSLLNGGISNIVCIGNINGFRSSTRMQFPGVLRSAILSAVQYSGAIGYFDTDKLYSTSTNGKGAGGVVVRARRDMKLNNIHYHIGDHNAYNSSGEADIAKPIYRVKPMRNLVIDPQKPENTYDHYKVLKKYNEVDDTGMLRIKKQNTYKLTESSLIGVPILGMASM